ncbi:asparaginase domain-containing protein [Maribacter chungangensis]|uniref:Asparaginase domain-containing protein n=1 Tax=Maribacter chungangensis TaxID=1069117 RepID=A0ABW3B733_9FLAO
MIWIITTGGTIEGLEYDNESENIVAPVSIKNLLKKTKCSVEYEIDNAFSKDSRFITQVDRELLSTKVKAANSEHILITHGTLTMVETAEYLGKLDMNKTIVLVGAFILATKKDTDAPANLDFAIAALQRLEKGVYIAMNEKVLRWDKVKKNIVQNRFEEKMD